MFSVISYSILMQFRKVFLILKLSKPVKNESRLFYLDFAISTPTNCLPTESLPF